MSLDSFAAAAVPIGLDALVAEAGLLTRVDRKYVLTSAELEVVTDTLAEHGGLAVLEIGGRRTFAYRSTYFDTPELMAWAAAGRGRRRRFKVRTREYVDTGATWLEVKTRGPRGTTVKRRVAHTEGPGRLGTRGREAVAALLLEGGVASVDPADLRPTLQTGYRRTTLLVAGSTERTPARATVDTALNWEDCRGGRAVTWSDLIVVETKGVRSPSLVDRTLWRLGQRPRSVSKYGAGLACVRPELPHLKWHRLLTELAPHSAAPASTEHPSGEPVSVVTSTA